MYAFTGTQAWLTPSSSCAWNCQLHSSSSQHLWASNLLPHLTVACAVSRGVVSLSLSAAAKLAKEKLVNIFCLQLNQNSTRANEIGVYCAFYMYSMLCIYAWCHARPCFITAPRSEVFSHHAVYAALGSRLLISHIVTYGFFFVCVPNVSFIPYNELFRVFFIFFYRSPLLIERSCRLRITMVTQQGERKVETMSLRSNSAFMCIYMHIYTFSTFPGRLRNWKIFDLLEKNV